jgi:thiol-disulfide isomerase/thioredoxin
MTTKPLLLLLAGALLGCGGQSESPSAMAESAEERATQQMPDLRFERLNGSSFQLSSLRGKRVFLSFWATWCKPCIQEMPSIAEAKQALGPRAAFLLVSDEPAETIKAFAEKKGYPLEFVKAGFALESLGITGLPTNIILNEKGEQEHFLVGARDWNEAEAQRLIAGN